MDKLIRILQELNPEVDFTTATGLIDDGLLDSFDIVTLVAELDEQFGVQISVVDLVPENFNSSAAIYALVQRLQENGYDHCQH